MTISKQRKVSSEAKKNTYGNLQGSAFEFQLRAFIFLNRLLFEHSLAILEAIFRDFSSSIAEQAFLRKLAISEEKFPYSSKMPKVQFNAKYIKPIYCSDSKPLKIILRHI